MIIYYTYNLEGQTVQLIRDNQVIWTKHIKEVDSKTQMEMFNIWKLTIPKQNLEIIFEEWHNLLHPSILLLEL